MFSGDSHTKQPQRQKPADPFSDLFKSPRSRGQIVKEDSLALGCDRDALLFSKIDPLDLSFTRKQTQKTTTSLEDCKKAYGKKEGENKDTLFRLTNKNIGKSPQEDLLSILCTDSNGEKAPPNKKKDAHFQNFLIETPKSPSDIRHSKKGNRSYRDMSLSTSPKASQEEFERLIDNYIRAEKPVASDSREVRRVTDPLKRPFDINHEQEMVIHPAKMHKYEIRPPGVDFRIHARAIPPTPLFRRINPYGARRPICGISPKQYPLNPTGVFPPQMMYAKARSMYPIGDYPPSRHPGRDRKVFRRGFPGQLITAPASQRSMLAVMKKSKLVKIRIKMFLLSKMSDEQQASIDKMVLTDESLKFKFFRTIDEVADILGLPRLPFRDVNELRILFNLFSRYGGYMNTNSSFLTSIKRSISKYHFRYLSYVIPLELSGYYYKQPYLQRQKARRASFSPTKEDLSTVVCIGIYDDIFYFLELLEAGDIPGGIIAELLNLFFLVSDILFKKFDRHLHHAEKLVYRLIAKPYRIVLERMPREILYQLQEVIFNIILKFEENKRVEQCLNGDTLSSILEAMLHRKVLKTFPEISVLDSGGCIEEVLVVKLINATSTIFQPTKKIISLVLGIGDIDTGLLLQTCSKILFDKQTLHSIFLKYRGFIIAQTKKHIATLESKVLLNDRKELEVIVTKFLPFAFKSEICVNELLKTLQEYKSHLLEKQVYFFKRKSSNVKSMIEQLLQIER
ncbi:hypothetical protein GINT2_000568 [Glugoides intestinalis]